MATIKHHEDLVAWQLANKLKVDVSQMVKRPHIAKDRRFCDEIRRSTRSAPSNLAEGFKKWPRENAHFVRIAIGSLRETENHLRDGLQEKYYPQSEFDELWKLAERAIGASVRWHKYLMRCPPGPPAARGDATDNPKP